MSVAMVDRLFWRAGFGPSQAQRDAWVGKRQVDLVDWFLNTPLTFAATDTPPKTGAGGAPIDPRVSDDELVMEWVDRMQRAVNPLPDRLAFFWHRHWAISRDDGTVSFDWAVKYRDRLLKYSNFQLTPTLNFRDMAYEITTADAAMSAYLNLNANTKTKPNENYARELMELFCLGPTAPDGTPNYSAGRHRGPHARAHRLAPELDADAARRRHAEPRLRQDHVRAEPVPHAGEDLPRRDDPGGHRPDAARSRRRTSRGARRASTQAIDIVLSHPQHAQFLIRKLWAEFIASPIPQATLDALITAYKAGNLYQLRPVIRGILTHPLIFESLNEPNLIKPPVIYAVGVLRQLGSPLKGNQLRGALINMQQQPYRPPNVAGWEGGLSWLNTNTVMGRFDMIVRAQYLKYSNYYRNTEVPPPAASINYPPDVNPETPQAVFDRAHAAVNRPWVSQATKDALIAWAGTTAALPVDPQRHPAAPALLRAAGHDPRRT